MTDKKGFILYVDYWQHLELLSDAEKAQLLTAVFAYSGADCEVPDLSSGAKIAFSFIRAQLDRDADKYSRRCERNRANGAKGGRPPKAKETESNPQEPTETERLFSEPKEPDTGTDTDTDTDTDTGTDNKGLLPGAETAPDQKGPPVVKIPLNDGSEHPIFQADIDKWAGLYPAVNIVSEVRKIAGWADANPRKRKTKGGITRHINGWLAKEQDKGGIGAPVGGAGGADGTPHPDGGVWYQGRQVMGVTGK